MIKAPTTQLNGGDSHHVRDTAEFIEMDRDQIGKAEHYTRQFLSRNRPDMAQALAEKLVNLKLIDAAAAVRALIPEEAAEMIS